MLIARSYSIIPFAVKLIPLNRERGEFLNENLATRSHRKKASSKYSYYLRKLVKKELVLSKKVGNAHIFWPLEVEKWRTIMDILEK